MYSAWNSHRTVQLQFLFNVYLDDSIDTDLRVRVAAALQQRQYAIKMFIGTCIALSTIFKIWFKKLNMHDINVQLN